MALKTTTAGLDPLTLTEWRNTFATWFGVTYATLSSEHQTELNRLINEAHEWVTNAFGHEPWAKRSTTFTIGTDEEAFTDTHGRDVFKMPADFRRLMYITETDGSSEEYRADEATDNDYSAALSGSNTHPWSTRTRAVWIPSEVTDDQPPQKLYARVGGMTSGTIRVFYRPFFSILASGADSYTVLDASVVAPLRKHVMSEWSLFMGEFQQAQQYRAFRNDDVAALKNADADLAQETPFSQGFDSEFWRQLG